MSREIDERIATEVMGWPKVGESKNGLFSFHEHPEWGRTTVGPMPLDGNIVATWSPSTDPADAMQVVEKIAEKFCCVRIQRHVNKDHRDGDPRDFWTVIVAPHDWSACGMISRVPAIVQEAWETFPMAICLAALRAVGGEGGKHV